MIGIIYIITNTINNKVYIGQTIQSLKDRWYGHCRTGFSHQERDMHIKRAIMKYGKDVFTIQELETCDTKDLNDREKFYIEKYNSYKEGYNSTIGGQNGGKPLKLNEEERNICIELYKTGFSLREIGKEFNVDKQTVKHILDINNIPLRKTRTYKYTPEERQAILDDLKIMSRKEVVKKWKISKSYLSQLATGDRRI